MATRISWRVYRINETGRAIARATSKYIRLLLETVDKEPSDLGDEFGRWTGERLATYLAEKTGIELSGSQVRRILKQKKYSYIWAKYSLEDKQNPQKRIEFKEKLFKYLAIANKEPERFQILFWAQSRRTEYSARRTCATRQDLVYESFDAKLGVRRGDVKRLQVNAAEGE